MDTYAHRAERILESARRMLDRAETDIQNSAEDTTEIEAELRTLQEGLSGVAARMQGSVAGVEPEEDEGEVDED